MPKFEELDRSIPILIVDDTTAMRRLMRTALETLGFANVTEAEDGSVALDKLREQEFGLILSDWGMPNVPGIDLLKAVRRDRQLKEIPFVMVLPQTARTADEAVQAGASACIVKPFNAEVLRVKMEQLFPE